MTTRIAVLLPLLLALPFSMFAGSDEYGLQLGSVAVGGGGGIAHSTGATGVHPNVGGELSVGLHKYVGVFAQGGWSPLLREKYCTSIYFCAEGKADLIHFAAGLELVGSNKSRVVPYGKFGMGYGRGSGSASAGLMSISLSQGTPAVAFGGGFKVYVSRHLGISTDISGMHFIGNGGGATLLVPTVGAFFQSK